MGARCILRGSLLWALFDPERAKLDGSTSSEHLWMIDRFFFFEGRSERDKMLK